jgi:cytochrome P450
MPSALQTPRYLGSHLSFLESCRSSYGSAFTLNLAPVGALVFVSDPDSARQIFANDREHTLPKGRTLTLEPVLGSRSILLLEGEEHMRRRKLMLPPFHGERMRSYEQGMVEATRAEIATWPRGEPFMLRERMQAITLEVILAAVFGVADGERHDRLRELLREILGYTRRSSSLILTLLTAPLGRFNPYGPVRGSLDEVDRLLFAEIGERRRDPQLDSREDILSMLVAARFDDGEAMSDEELRDQLMTLLVAGHETTATALSWAFEFLLQDPDALKRAQAAAAAGDDAYLDAIGTEAQRLRPVITSVGRKLGAPAELGGYELDEGTSVMVAVYLLQTRPDLYPDPYVFRPERFVDSRPDTYSWLPFGGGIRRCIGAAFAGLELRVVLGEVLNSVTLQAAGKPERPRLAGITLVPRSGVRVLASPR